MFTLTKHVMAVAEIWLEDIILININIREEIDSATPYAVNSVFNMLQHSLQAKTSIYNVFKFCFKTLCIEGRPSVARQPVLARRWL